MKLIAYRPEIDGLRAIAIAAVVLYHADLGVPGGLVGVDIFFAISGYLITSLLYAEWTSTHRIDLLAFYARRLLRLIPALVVVVMVVMAACIFLRYPYGPMKDLGKSAAASLLFVANFYFQSHTGGYFDPLAIHLPFLHLWSLGVEEQFYLVWPSLLIFILISSRSALRPIFLIAATSLVLCGAFAVAKPNVAFYEMPTRLWELAIGALIAVSPIRQIVDGRPLMVGGLAVIVVSCFSSFATTPGVGVLPSVFGAGLILYVVHNSLRMGWVGQLLAWKPAVYTGQISYSLYLWHWPVLVLASMHHLGSLPVIGRIGLCAASLLLASASLYFLERPFRKRRTPFQSRTVVVVTPIVVLATAVIVMSAGHAFHTKRTPNDLALRTSVDWPPAYFDCHYKGEESLADFPKRTCASDANPQPVVIWGDSHALAWQPFARELALHEQSGYATFTRDACPPALDYDNGRPLIEEALCRDFNQRVIMKIEGVDTLILAGLWPPTREFAERFEATVRLAAVHVRKIILIGPTPWLRYAVPECMRLQDLAACAISRAEFVVQSGAPQTYLRSIASKYPRVEYVDVSDFFCDRDNCPAVKDGYGLYWDNNHVSSTAAFHFARQYLNESPAH